MKFYRGRFLQSFDRNQRLSLFDGAASSLMVGLGETYLAAFLLSNGASGLAAGLTVATPLMIGALLQFLAKPLLAKLPYRVSVLCGASTQALVFLPLTVFAFRQNVPFLAVYLLTCLYWASSMFAAPAWNAWIDRLIPVDRRNHFWGFRGRICQGAIFTGFLLGGLTLQMTDVHRGFTIIFLGAFFARLFSVYLLSQHEEVPNQAPANLSLLQFLGQFRRTESGRFIYYLFAMHFAVQVSAPYFAPFMLTQLKLSYGHYVILIACSYLGRMLAYPYFGRLAAKIGVKRLLLVSGIAVMPMAGIWVFSSNYYYLIGVQILGGMAWAGFELASALTVFERIDIRARASVLSYLNLFQSSATALGSLLGGLLLFQLGQAHEVFLAIFATSSLLRALTLGMLLRAVDLSPRQASVVLLQRMRRKDWTESEKERKVS